MPDPSVSQSGDSLIAKAADAIRGKWPNQRDGDFYGDGVEGDCEHVARTVIEMVEAEFTLIPKNLREGISVPVVEDGPWEDEDPRHYAHRMGDPDA